MNEPPEPCPSCKELEAQCAAVRQLLKEIIDQHKDPDAPEYNECDKDRCFWCEKAQAFLDGTAGRELLATLVALKARGDKLADAVTQHLEGGYGVINVTLSKALAEWRGQP